MNAARQETTAFEALEEVLARFGAFAVLRALIAHRLRRPRRGVLMREDMLSDHLIRDLGLHEPRARWQDPGNWR